MLQKDIAIASLCPVRSYDQFCSLARALDLLGERWTLLLVRELLLGPRRFRDLAEALDGIGPNLLSTRLRRLGSEGVIRRAGREYELTRRGRGLEGPVLALARWGMDPLAPPDAGERLAPQWYVVALWAAAGEPIDGPDERYGLVVDGEPFHLEHQAGSVRARRGPAADPAFVLTTGVGDLLAIATGARGPSPEELRGDGEAFGRFLAAHALPRPVATGD